MIRQAFTSVVVTIAVFAFKGASARGDGTSAPVPTTQEAVGATTAALDATIEEFKSDGEPLDEVIQRIATTYKLKINMQWDALKKAGIDRKTPVNLTLHSGLHVGELLRQVVRVIALGLAVNDRDLLPERSIRDNGEIVVTTHADLFERFVSTRKYQIPKSRDRHLFQKPKPGRSPAISIVH